MKRAIAYLLSLCLLLSLAGCSQKKDIQNETEAPTEAEAEPVGAETGNPLRVSDREGVQNELGVTLDAPEGAEEVRYILFDTEPKMAELSFTYEGRDYTYRVAPSEQGKETIHGLYYKWTESQEMALGGLTATLRYTDGGAGVISWFDAAPGLLYALSMPEGASADTLTAMAVQLFVPVQGDVDGGEIELSGTPLAADPTVAAAFTALMERIRTEARPGTAGGSLVAANLCASLCEELRNCEGRTGTAPVWEVAAEALEAYRSGLDADTRELFEQQMESVLSAFAHITDTHGQELLDTAGCTISMEGWDLGSLRCAMAGLTMAGVDRTPYEGILSAYATAIQEGWDKGRRVEAGVNFMSVDCAVGYLLKDLDGDGTTELVIASMSEDDFFRGMVLDLYTLSAEGVPALVLQSMERDRWYNAFLPVLHHESSSSAWDSVSEVVLYADGQLETLSEAEARTANPLPLLPITG